VILQHLVNYQGLLDLVKDQALLAGNAELLQIPRRIASCFANPEKEEEILLGITGISATVLPIQSVGVQGDGRTYRYAFLF